MKKLHVIAIVLTILISSCGYDNHGELMGVPGRTEWFDPEPHGMVFVPMGSYNMGPSAEDVAFAMNATTKTVSVDPFWMDDTEITNNEYRQFVYWVRDSIARVKLGENGFEEDFLITEDDDGNPIDPPYLNWEEEIDWGNKEYEEALSYIALPEHERFYRRKEVDTRKLIYEYFWVDLKQAAKKENRYNFKTQEYSGDVIDSKGNKVPVKDRSSFIMKGSINVYPDTLCWMSDFTYSFNEPWAKNYFWHPAFDDYPVAGVNWVQAQAFCIWRTQLMNNYLVGDGRVFVEDYRLPTEAEWEYAARGGLAHSMYPWGGPYTRNKTGCFITNFKPLRGNYGDDGANRTLTVGTYAPNDYGLFDMAGNLAEWTSNAFEEAGYMFTHDLNPDYRYTALSEDPPALKRKVIRGGSWKDIAFYLQNGTRAYEYQDTSKSYVGFRCVRSYMGRDDGLWNSTNFD
jgi:formylglycine-generating enzyme required for sulfatase activity